MTPMPYVVSYGIFVICNPGLLGTNFGERYFWGVILPKNGDLDPPSITYDHHRTAYHSISTHHRLNLNKD